MAEISLERIREISRAPMGEISHALKVNGETAATVPMGEMSRALMREISLMMMGGMSHALKVNDETAATVPMGEISRALATSEETAAIALTSRMWWQGMRAHPAFPMATILP
jgi:hypothetical protein